MRRWHLFCGELRFLGAYGIVALYVIFTALYLLLLGALPAAVRQSAAVLLVFTDPAAMGLFFMGAMVLLEKSQRVNSSLAVSPVTVDEYIAAKVLALALIGTAVGAVLLAAADLGCPPAALLGIALSSALFSLCGLFAAAQVRTLNGFFIAVIPFEIVLCLPAVLALFGVLSAPWWVLHPGVAAIRLIGSSVPPVAEVASLIVWTAVTLLFCRKVVQRSFYEMGGGTL